MLARLRVAQGARGWRCRPPPRPSSRARLRPPHCCPAAVVVDRSHWGRLRLGGEDRLSFLHGQSTADVAALRPGTGCDTVRPSRAPPQRGPAAASGTLGVPPATAGAPPTSPAPSPSGCPVQAFVTAQARLLDLATVYAQGSGALVVVSPGQAAPLAQRLDKYIFPGDKVGGRRAARGCLQPEQPHAACCCSPRAAVPPYPTAYLAPPVAPLPPPVQVQVADISPKTCMFSILGPSADGLVQALQAGAIVGAPAGSHTLLSCQGAGCGCGLHAALVCRRAHASPAHGGARCLSPSHRHPPRRPPLAALRRQARDCRGGRRPARPRLHPHC